MNLSKYEEYIVKWDKPVQKNFVKYWISIFDKDSMERIGSTLINRNRSDSGYYFEKDVKTFMQKTLSAKIDADALRKEELTVISNISITEHELRYNHGDLSLELESNESNLFILITEMEDTVSYEKESELRDQKLHKKSQPFIQMLIDTYELSESELDFLVPTHKHFVCNEALMFNIIEESCRKYSFAR